MKPQLPFLIVAFYFSTCVSIVAQNNSSGNSQRSVSEQTATTTNGNYLTGGTYVPPSINYEKASISGSPYIFENYRNAIVFNQAGKKSVVFAKYNAFEGVSSTFILSPILW